MAKKQLSIVNDCIAPLSEGLRAVVHRWDRVGVERVGAMDIRELYRNHHVEMVETFLSVSCSVDLARQFGEKLRGPLERLDKLETRACQLLDGDFEGNREWVRGYQDPVRQWLDSRCQILALDQALARSRGTEPTECSDYPWGKYLDEVAEASTEVRIAFEDASRYLHRLSVTLDGSPANATDETATAVPLDDKDVAILGALASAGVLQDMYELETATHLSRKTISGRLSRLREAGLTDRPKGDRRGETITDSGRKRLADVVRK